LSPQFWSDFADQDWEKRPLLIKQPFSTPLLNKPELFRALLASSQAYCRDPSSVPLQFCIGHSQMMADIPEFLPVAKDGDIFGYTTRLARTLNGQDFALSIQHVQEHAREIWLRLREFLSSAAEFVALPDDFTKATLFFGRYSKEPRGIHAGNSSNFKFVIYGKKRMRFWPSRFFREKEAVSHSTGYERFLPAATTLEGTAGDILYWPSDSWHVVECVDGLAASISLALFTHSRSSRIIDFWRHAGDVMQTQTPGPRAIPKLHRAAQNIVNSEPARKRIASTLKAEWLNRATGFGFERVPPPRSQEQLHDDNAVRVDPQYPIRWSKSNEGWIVCSVNGNAFEVIAHPHILRVIRRLNSGEICRPRDLIGQRNGVSPIGEGIRGFLEKLYALDGISEVSVCNTAARRLANGSPRNGPKRLRKRRQSKQEPFGHEVQTELKNSKP
jgi:50S ribosomal protein L16 3-hydroxylase